MKNASTTNSYVLNYIPEKKWLDTKKRRQGFGNFSGIIQLIHLDGEVFSEVQYDNGKIISSEGINSRIAGCRTERVVTGYTTVCFENQCIISEVRFADVEICDPSPSDGDGDGDGDSSSGSGGGSGDGSPNPNLGNPGPLDPEDIGYWLSTVFEGDDLNNPYHGMKAIAPDGTVYTYDADINGWLMPDVTVLEEQGFIADFFNTPDFDGGIISSIGVVLGQGTSRTPVGRLVVGFVTFNLWLYSIYEMSTTLEDKLATVEHCTRLYELCTGRYGYKNMDCGNCQIYCDTNGYWDSRCPLRDY